MRRERARTEEMAAEAEERRTTRSKTNATAMMRKSFSDMTSFRRNTRTKKLHRSNKNTVPVIVTTSCIGTALIGVKSQISPNLFDGIEVRKLSKRGTIVSRVLTLSDDLFKIIVSHPMGVREVESVIDLLRYKSIETVHIKRKLRTIDVSDILFVQSGFVGSRRLEACTLDCLDPTKVITIFYKNFKTMDILMDNEEDVSAVLYAIQLIRDTYDTAKNKFARETLLLRYVWNDIDWKKSGLIKQSDFLQLLRRINVYIKKEKAIQIFRQYTTAKRLKKGSTGRTTAGSMRRVSMTTIHRQNGITFDECIDALKQVKLECSGRHLITDIIFNEIFGDKTDVVTTKEFMEKFLRQKQKEYNVTLENTRRIFSKLNNIEIVGSHPVEGAMDRLRFGEYLFSSRNDGFDPKIQQFDSSTLTRPFPSYWINSSHNTYLTADQFQSESSVQMYAVALQR
jgi:CxxC motif-containing protein